MIRNLNQEEFNRLIQEDKPVLVDFWAPWCGYCRRLDPVYGRIAQQYGDDVIIAKVNIDDEAALSDAERIELIPTLVLYQNGKALGSLVAPRSKAVIDCFLQENL